MGNYSSKDKQDDHPMGGDGDPRNDRHGQGQKRAAESISTSTSAHPQPVMGIDSNGNNLVNGSSNGNGSNTMTDTNITGAGAGVGVEASVVVPTVFKWEHGGREVYITGTFNNWEKRIPMHRSGNDFSYVHNLKKGKHAFKFIVDDEWRLVQYQYEYE
jgi:hypothetical protein